MKLSNAILLLALAAPAGAEPVHNLQAQVVHQSDGISQTWTEAPEALFEEAQLTSFGGAGSIVLNTGRIYVTGDQGFNGFVEFYNEGYTGVVLHPDQILSLRITQVTGTWQVLVKLGNPNYYAEYYLLGAGQGGEVTQRGLLTLPLPTDPALDLSNITGIGLSLRPQGPGSLTIRGIEVSP